MLSLARVKAQTTKSTVNYKLLSPGGPSPQNLARPLMVRQPYSVAVLSTRGRLHPLVPEVSVPYKGNRRGRKDY